MTNLKKGHAQAKSSDCLLSPDDASFSSSSSLDRSVSQPNVAVPVPSLPQLGVPVSDQLPSVPHTRQILGGQDPEDNGNTLPDPGGVSSGSDAVERISDGRTSDSGASGELLDVDLDVIIPASGHSPSQFPPGEVSQFDAKMLLPGGVRKSTSFRDPSETPQRPASGVVLKSSSSGGRADSTAPKSGVRMGSKSSTLPPNLVPPYSVMPGMAGFDSDLLEEINSFSTLSRSSPGEARKKAVPPTRPRPPTKKAVDNNRTTSASNTAIPPGIAKPNIAVTSSPETASKK